MIFDCFPFFNELDVLEIRLNEHNDFVDKFVIVESTQTFQGGSKPLIFKDNESRYSKFKDKIIHVVCEFPQDIVTNPKKYGTPRWSREHYQRNAIGRGLKDAKEDDIVIVADVDEILNKELLSNHLSTRKKNTATVFIVSSYYHYMNRKTGSNHGPRLIEYRNFPGGQKLRALKDSINPKSGAFVDGLHVRLRNYWESDVRCPVGLVRNAGWHFSSIGGWNDYRLKMESFSHTECKQEEIYLSEDKFKINLLRDASFAIVDEMPQYVRNNLSKFGKYMLEVCPEQVS